MRPLLLYLFSLCLLPLFAHMHFVEAREMTFYSLLLDDTSSPRSALSQLLFLLNISHENTLDSIVASTQKNWIQTGKERWEFEALEEEKKEQLVPLFQQIGLFDESNASRKEYDYALVYGGFYSRVQKRIQHLIEEYERGVCFKEVILLTGQRYLDPNTSERSLPFKTETEMMQFVWENSTMPQGLRDLPMRLIDTPRQAKPDESIVRPGTKDTLTEWLKTEPRPGSCLFISSQPFCGYQDSVARTYLPSSLEIETIGPKAGVEPAVSIYLDNLARWLYQEKIRRENDCGISP